MKKIVFIYNANSGKMNSLMESAHKIISPKTYKCDLCAMTYGVFKINPEWKKFIDGLPHELEFLHKNEIPKELGKYLKSGSVNLPAVLEFDDKNYNQLVSSEEFKNMNNDVNVLIEKLKSKLGL